MAKNWPFNNLHLARSRDQVKCSFGIFDSIEASIVQYNLLVPMNSVRPGIFCILACGLVEEAVMGVSSCSLKSAVSGQSSYVFLV